MSSIAFADKCDLTQMPDSIKIDPDTPAVLVTTVCKDDEHFGPSTYSLSCNGYTLGTCKMLATVGGNTSKLPITAPLFVGCDGKVAEVNVKGQNTQKQCTVPDGIIYIKLNGGSDAGPNITMTFTKTN